MGVGRGSTELSVIGSQLLGRAKRSSEISQCVGVGSAVVRGSWIGHATGRSDSCRIGDGTRRGSTDCAAGFVGNLACNWHDNGVVNIAGAAGAESGRSATLSGGVGHTSEGARKGIPDNGAADLTRPGITHRNRVGVLCAGQGRGFAIINRDV